jgi:hypothetical protein
MSAAMMNRKARPGDEVTSYCGRCKDERTHQVIALNSDAVPATVICRTCREQHRYRPKRPGEPAASRKGTSTASGRVARPAAKEEPTTPPRPYSPRETYAEGEWVVHTKFGTGRVISARAGKIEVKFEGGARLLVHAG